MEQEIIFLVLLASNSWSNYTIYWNLAHLKRPIRKITARWYSETILIQKKGEIGKVTISISTDKSLATTSIIRLKLS